MSSSRYLNESGKRWTTNRVTAASDDITFHNVADVIVNADYLYI